MASHFIPKEEINLADLSSCPDKMGKSPAWHFLKWDKLAAGGPVLGSHALPSIFKPLSLQECVFRIKMTVKKILSNHGALFNIFFVSLPIEYFPPSYFYSLLKNTIRRYFL